MFALSIVSLWVVLMLAMVGALAPPSWFDDNLLQRIGLGAIAFGTLSGLLTGAVSLNGQICMQIGIAIFALGTAIKVWRHRPRKPPRVHRYPWAG